MKTNTSNYVIYSLCLLWCGLLVGVSFIATPAKFLVAELDLVTAIKVGRATFEVYRYVELVVAGLVFLALCLLRIEKASWVYFTLLGLVLLAQYCFVQPLVEANSDKLFAGIESQARSSAHLYYIFCDCLKVIILLGFLPATLFINRNSRSN